MFISEDLFDLAPVNTNLHDSVKNYSFIVKVNCEI